MSMRTALTSPLAAGLLSIALLAPGCKKDPPETASSPPPTMEAPPPAPAPAPRRTEDEAMTALRGNFEKVFFDTDQATLDEASRTALSDNAEILREYPQVVVEVQGHADERGTEEHNRELGAERAAAVVEHLVAQGVERERLRPITLGETDPAVEGDDPAVWAQNRRVEFRILRGPRAAGSSATPAQ